MLKNLILPVILFLSLLLAACGQKVVATSEIPLFTSTPDPCLAENLPAEVAKINKLTREFDDYAALASNTPQAQLIQIIPELQRGLREAEDLIVPACLNNLKQLQINYMKTVVQTFMAFMNAKDNAGVELVNAGIAQGRSLHEQYDVEIAHLLGITLVAPSTLTPVATP